MKKAILALLMCATVVTSLTACGRKETPEETAQRLHDEMKVQ